MKEVWVLSVKTSLPDVCWNSMDLKTTFSAFDSFEKGREAMRKVLRDLAFSKNSMFDGNGNIIHFKKYLEDMCDEEYIDDGEVLDKNRLSYVSDSFREAFSGKDIYFEMENAYCTDWMIAIESGVGEVYFHGEDDGPCNGYDPDIAANIFSMQEEKDYFLYINDRFGQDDATSELYIDLKKVSIS